jgi:hypothetical protein
LFTPNAAGTPFPIQLINSFGMEIDISASSFRITFLHIPGSNTGFGGPGDFDPDFRVNLTDLNPSDGNPSDVSFISGVSQTGGNAPHNPFSVCLVTFVGVNRLHFLRAADV